MSHIVRLLITPKQENAVRGLFTHYGWDFQEEGNDDNSVSDVDSPSDNGTKVNIVIPRDESAVECDHCLCQPCVTTSRQDWSGDGQRPSVLNAGVRKRIYKKYWTLLDRRGAWRDERYLSKKADLMLADEIVVTKRQVMPTCVLRQVRALYPNLPRQPYRGYR